jgi:hypothetical protein
MLPIAYLEISGRQTGKTTRLIVRARQLADAGTPVVFVTPLYEHLRPIKGVVFQRDGRENATVPEGAVWMFDEFDFTKRVTVREGAYYATTPARWRDLSVDSPQTDMLLRLIAENGGQYIRHLPRHDTAQLRKEMPPIEYRLYIHGEFIA